MGKYLYDLCDGNHGVDELADRIVERFDVTPEVAEADVDQFLSLLVQNRVMLRAGQPTLGPVHHARHSHKLDVNQRLPLSASFNIRGRCNLRCVHCYVAGERRKPDLKTEQVFLIIDKLSTAGCLMLQLTGGECTLREDFVEVYLYAKHKGMLVTVSTNATLLTPTIVQTLAKYPPRWLSISLYGARAATYERVTRRSGSFHSFVSGVEMLRAYEIAVELKAVLLKENVADFELIREFATAHGCLFRPYFGIVPRHPNGFSFLGYRSRCWRYP